MSIALLPVLLASASSLLLPPLSAATGEVYSIDTDDLSFWLLVAVAPGLVMLVALGIRYLGGSRIDDDPDTAAKPPVDAERHELAQFMREAIEQLNGIYAALRDTIPEAGQAPGQAASSATGRALPSRQDCDGNGGSATTAGHIAKPVDTREETASRTNLVALSCAIEATRSVTRDKALSELAAKMSTLTELANRLHEERLALSRNTTAPSLTLEDSDSPAENRHYLSFALGDEQFAISTLSVYGAVEATQLIAEPSMPPKVRKAIRLRGALVPVIDLGAHFGGQPIEIGWNSRIILLEVTSRERLQIIGVVVDTVGKVLEIAPADIQPPAASDSQIRNDFALGTVTLDSRLITLLDIGQGLSAHELVALRSAAQAVTQENMPT